MHLVGAMAGCRGCPGALAVLALLLLGAAAETKGGLKNGSIIEVSNGGPRGAWAWQEMCAPGTFVTGFSLKVEPYQGSLKDDTAVNGIRLFCTRGGREQRLETNPVESQSGPWGRWSEPLWCSSGSYVQGFSLKAEQPRSTAQDYMGVTNIRFACSDGQILEGDGLRWGQYEEWSPPCGKGLCGIQTKVEPQRGGLKDDSSVNDVRFPCCAN
uniref:Vitelline membrane outer layer protein 1 homolog n=1 Tax=Pogona vitticeps TaxID=103695 RepID=A0A6J0U633_9SAUR